MPGINFIGMITIRNADFPHFMCAKTAPLLLAGKPYAVFLYPPIPSIMNFVYNRSIIRTDGNGELCIDA